MRLFALFLFGTFTYDAAPTSPRIESFIEALRIQQTGASERFWTEVQRDGGTPLIECPSALAPDCLVTFLWRGDGSTKNVVVKAEAVPGPPSKEVFNHVADSDVWYRTYRFRNDARFMYMLSINDPLTTWEVEGPQRSARFAGVRADPLNQRSPGYVSLPNAPSEKWSEKRPETAHGEIRRYSRASAAMSGERVIDVYATPGFKRGRGLTPVLILFDGDESRDMLRVPIILDNLYSDHRIGEMLAVFLVQPYEHRETDLECSQNTNLYLVNELLPWLREEYEIRTEPGSTVAAGASLGGLAATYAGLRHPEAIGKVLSQSGSFWWGKTDSQPEWLTAEVRSSQRVKVDFYLDVGLMETNGEKLSQLETNRQFKNALERKGYHVIYREFNGIHGFPCWRAGFADALAELLSD